MVRGCMMAWQGLGDHMKGVETMDKALESAQGGQRVDCLFLRGAPHPPLTAIETLLYFYRRQGRPCSPTLCIRR